MGNNCSGQVNGLAEISGTKKSLHYSLCACLFITLDCQRYVSTWTFRPVFKIVYPTQRPGHVTGIMWCNRNFNLLKTTVGCNGIG